MSLRSNAAPAFRVPAFETERLTLSGHTLADFDDCIALWSDPEVVRFIGGKPSSREAVWARLVRYVGHWALLGYGYWVVREKASGRFLGEVGFANFQREIEPPLGDLPEGGWVLLPWGHGKGFGTEAVRGALGWLAASRPEFTKSVCIIDPKNAASIRVASKCGYVPLDVREFHGDQVSVYERTA